MGLRIHVIASWSLLAAVAAGGPAAARADLAASSPFLPPGLSGAAGDSGPAGPVELRGVMSTPQGMAYCIYDTVKKTGTWVGVNEGGYDFKVKSADPGGESVTVDLRGQVMKLTLHTAKVASAGIAGSVAVAAPQNGLGQGVALNPTPADEQRRLDAVASEVRRRKAEREKAAQAAAANPGGAAPAAPTR